MPVDAEPEEITSCPCCGAITGTKLAQAPALLAVCDVLVVRALEAVGKRIVRSGGRSMFPRVQGRRNARAWHLAHTVRKPDAEMVNTALDGAWDIIPAMLNTHGCCGVNTEQVTSMLDSYVRDLLITGTAHNLRDLRYRFEKYLGIPLPVLPLPYSPPPTDDPDEPPEWPEHGLRIEHG